VPYQASKRRQEKPNPNSREVPDAEARTIPMPDHEVAGASGNYRSLPRRCAYLDRLEVQFVTRSVPTPAHVAARAATPERIHLVYVFTRRNIRELKFPNLTTQLTQLICVPLRNLRRAKARVQL
jgi:hypothetical protein